MKTYEFYREFIHDLTILVTSVILLVIFTLPGPAQTLSGPNKNGQMTLYPGITGQQLLDSLIANYKTTTVLSYNAARDTLYGRIFNVDDSLSGVYSLFSIYVDPFADPSTDAFNKGINAEHTWPQSKGAGSGTPRSDMHNLRPARVQVNSARANYPFGESNDADTDSWFRRDQQLNSIPGSLIDEYTEVDNDGNVFEPREAYKGDVARTMFYFYTMYRTEADNADPDFFDLQKDTLLAWHRQDPPDSTESARSDSVGHWQDGLANPFILDTSLVARAYFAGSITAAPSPLLITAIGPDTLQISWSLPIGYETSDNELLLLCQSGSIIDDDPTGSPVSSYTANETFGSGSEVGSGSFAVYKGDGTSTIIRGLTTGTVYHFSMWNTLSNTTYSTIPTQINTTTSSGGAASTGDVIISEIMKNPQVVSDSDGEWFELFNATASPIDINGWTIADDGIDSHVISNGSALI
ncbi:MAG: endonuclease, partial [Calditrichota bacterium]